MHFTLGFEGRLGLHVPDGCGRCRTDDLGGLCPAVDIFRLIDDGFQILLLCIANKFVEMAMEVKGDNYSMKNRRQFGLRSFRMDTADRIKTYFLCRLLRQRKRRHTKRCLSPIAGFILSVPYIYVLRHAGPAAIMPGARRCTVRLGTYRTPGFMNIDYR